MSNSVMFWMSDNHRSTPVCLLGTGRALDVVSACTQELCLKREKRGWGDGTLGKEMLRP